jgi:hypothetical protein
LNCLEAGQDEYEKRRNEAYEILKNWKQQRSLFDIF